MTAEDIYRQLLDHGDEIEELQRRIAAKHGYQIEEHALVLYVRKKR
jgi:Fe2+ or Zn2+ uptake regulation protein